MAEHSPSPAGAGPKLGSQSWSPWPRARAVALPSLLGPQLEAEAWGSPDGRGVLCSLGSGEEGSKAGMIRGPVLRWHLACLVAPQGVHRSHVRDPPLHPSLILDPGPKHRESRVHAWLVLLCTAFTPAHHACLEDPPIGLHAGQGATRVALRRQVPSMSTCPAPSWCPPSWPPRLTWQASTPPLRKPTHIILGVSCCGSRASQVVWLMTRISPFCRTRAPVPGQREQDGVDSGRQLP